MQITRIRLLILCLTATAALATATSAQSSSGGVTTTQTTQNANRDLSDCVQMLDQSIAETRALRSQSAALQALIAANDEVIKRLRSQIEEQQRLIETYERRKGVRVSFLFGLIKITKY